VYIKKATSNGILFSDEDEDVSLYDYLGRKVDLYKTGKTSF
jgi:hypothetical protein